jgi:dTDP-4-dehydrorhamnose reductase
MRFAVIGDKGMFGQEMRRYLEAGGHKVSGFNRTNLNLTNSPQLLMEAIGPVDVLINAVAYTFVDEAEVNESLANRVNGEYAGKLAEVAFLAGAKFMHISTDYVFPGNTRFPIGVTTPADPINAYGRSKLLGEKLVAESGARYQIFRTAWLYGSSGSCFPKAIALKCRKESFVNVVNDQFGQPTWTRDLSAVIHAHSFGDFEEPIVHAVASGEASWYDFAVAVTASMDRNTETKFIAISSQDLNLAAKRPAYSILSNTETQGPIIGDWRERWKVASSDVLNSIK